ncbi:MAG: C39 family peptidase [Bacilli bacterium]|nr:C39 family peptidase [Bacilli bacterium]
MAKKKKIILGISIGVSAALVLAVLIPFMILGIRSASIKKNYAYLKDDPIYSEKQEVTGIELVKQEISCGYATIEMMSSFYGNKVTEKELSDKNNGAITTQTSDGFLKELRKTIPEQKFVKHSYLNNDVLLKEIVIALSDNRPVALEWAAKYEEEWTLHFSLISAIDIKNDNITIYNPYGYIESITINEFISRTTFEAYKNMPLFLNFGFAFGAFEKNTIFY